MVVFIQSHKLENTSFGYSGGMRTKSETCHYPPSFPTETGETFFQLQKSLASWKSRLNSGVWRREQSSGQPTISARLLHSELSLLSHSRHPLYFDGFKICATMEGFSPDPSGREEEFLKHIHHNNVKVFNERLRLKKVVNLRLEPYYLFCMSSRMKVHIWRWSALHRYAVN